MFQTLPSTVQEFSTWTWAQIEPYYRDLLDRPLAEDSIAQWLADWTRLQQLLDETFTRLRIATTVNTEDKAAAERLQAMMVSIVEPSQTAEQKLKQKLLASGLTLPGMEIPIRNLRTEAGLFTQANVPLFTQEVELGLRYDRISGAQTVVWEGQERTLIQMKTLLQSDDRALRETVWRRIAERRLQDRAALNDLWTEYLSLRAKMAANAGFSSYRDLRWKQLKRFDYTPADCQTFHAAIEQVVVPAATRVYERQRALLGVESLRPWDLDRDDVYHPTRPPLYPFQNIEELEYKAEAIFHKVDPELGDYFTTMRREKLLDLGNRKGKAPGGYQSSLVHAKRPFIFMNAVGVHDDVQTLLHEGGHAFHWFEASRLPYVMQWDYGAEIAEVASMSMELLAAPYLTQDCGGYYSAPDAAHARIHHLERAILFWPYMAVVDAFQHWVYTHIDQAADPARCDAQWGELWSRFIPGVDWSGLEDARVTGWQRKLHIYKYPFYYVDYGLAQVGAVQVWRNALKDQAGAVRRYREALTLGGTRSLPELFAAAGAKFAFDAATLGELVALMEQTIADLGAQVH
jgi:oligoendopeptidase F